MYYGFEPMPVSLMPDVIALVAPKPVYWTVMPQYTRTGFRFLWPVDGGVRYGQQWQVAQQSQATAVFLCTFNGTGDGSQIAGYPALEAATLAQSAAWLAAGGG